MFGIFRRKRTYDEIIQSIEQKRREKGEAALTNPERRLYEGHVFEAYFFHQGGFDYYFAHVEGVERWAQATGALIAIGHDDVTPIFHEAAKHYLSFIDENADNFLDANANQEATKAYLVEMKELDSRFRAAVPDLGVQLQEYAKQI